MPARSVCPGDLFRTGSLRMDFDEDLKLRVWNELPMIANYDPADMRIDRLHNKIRLSDCNDRGSRYGWGIRSWLAGRGDGPRMFEALHHKELD
jgi:hypothetical protein